MTKLRSGDLIAVLRENPRVGSALLCAKLGGIDKSTLVRGLKALGDSVVSCGGSRRKRYALRRPVRGNETPLPLYRIDEHGRGQQIGLLQSTYPHGTALSFQGDFAWPLPEDMRDGWFEGLPYPLYDMRPQGFLGRNFAKRYALDLNVSENPQEWSDDDVLHVCSIMGHDLPGNLILGDVAYRRFLEHTSRALSRFLSEEQIATAYPQLAVSALAQGEVGSTAAGEFPKFTCSRLLAGEKVDVIVKFSGADESAAVRRWSDLLVCEHLALEVMQNVLQVAAAQSRIYRFAGRTFLEVIRFDRHGEFGRSALCTLGSLNAALLGMAAAPWNKVAARLHSDGYLPQHAIATIDLIRSFGKLIANTDMHEGNLAFRPGLSVAPVYDMLPMFYAPMRGGEVPGKAFLPELPLPSERPIWISAAAAAVHYWERCASDVRISPAFQAVCGENVKALQKLLAQQMPSA